MKREGDTGFHITCTAIGKPKPTVKWFKDGQEILDSETNLYQIKNTEQETIANTLAYNVLSTLKFVGPDRITNEQLMPNDRGQYTCKFENEVDVAESSMLLRIEHAPVVVHQHNKVAFDLDQTAFISCKMQAFPAPKFDWSFGQSILQNSPLFYDTNITALGNDIYEGVLRINKVTDNSYGSYTCKGRNSMGDKRTIIKLQRKGKPEKPINVHAITIGYNFISVGFDPGFDGGYNNTSHSLEYRRYESSVPNYVDCFTNTFCNITDLEQHSQYYIKVKASNIKGESKYTGEISVATKLDKDKIPKPKSVHFEKTTNTASFLVENDVYLDLVAKVEVKNEKDDQWTHYNQLALNPSNPLSEIAINDRLVNNLRVSLCLETNEILCGPWTPAEFVDVRPPISLGMGLTNAHIAGLAVLAVLGAGFIACTVYCCCCKGNSTSTKNPGRPSIVHQTHSQNPPPYHTGKNFDSLKFRYCEKATRFEKNLPLFILKLL